MPFVSRWTDKSAWSSTSVNKTWALSKLHQVSVQFPNQAGNFSHLISSNSILDKVNLAADGDDDTPSLASEFPVGGDGYSSENTHSPRG